MAILILALVVLAAMYLAPLMAIIWYVRLNCPRRIEFVKFVAQYYGISFLLLIVGVTFPMPLGLICELGFLFAVITGPVIAMWIINVGRRAKRHRTGHCQSCSYDLTGNVSGVCPECGAEVLDSYGS